MWQTRLKRIGVILLLAALFAAGAKAFADYQNKQKAAGKDVPSLTDQIGEKISDFGQKVLGNAVEVIPGAGGLKEKLIIEKQVSVENVQGEEKQVERIEIQTHEIINIIKELPADQVDKVKKQIFKDFCQEILEEE